MTITRRLLLYPVVLGGVALAVACSDSTDSTDSTPVAISSEVAGGDGQTALVGTALPLPLQVRVTRGSAPAAGVEVVWQAAAGSLVISSNLTDANGVAHAGWVLGGAPGPQTATASVAGARGSPMTLHATALDYVTATIDPASQGQSGVVGTELGRELRLIATSAGRRAANVAVVWSTTSGTVLPAASLTDTNGVATARWTLGGISGPQTAAATVARSREGPLVFVASATLLPGTIITKQAGSDSQSTPANFPPVRLRVSVTDAYGNIDTTTSIVWSVVNGAVTLEPNPWSKRLVTVRSSGTPGVATVRAALAGAQPSVDFTVTILPKAPMVILEVGAATDLLSGFNGTRPAVDTIAVGGTMTWFLSTEDLEDHVIAPVGLPEFVGGGLGYGGTLQGLEITFAAPGTYHYEDSVWPGVVGTLVVQ